MSNFICPTCGLTNIDCGKAGYKTAREIELEKKLEIAKEKLETIKTTATFGKLKGINVDTPDSMRLKAIVTLAEDALKKIRG